MYDVTSEESFHGLQRWVDQLKQNAESKIIIILIGNKIDLERKVSQETAQAYAKEQGLGYIECSAKQDTGISSAFKTLVS